MSVITPPSVTALPSPPDPGNRTTFNTLAYPWSAALPTFSTQLQALANNVALNATDAYTNATSAAGSAVAAAASATAAAATAGAGAWVNGNTYALNACAISQIDFQAYRKRTASSVTSIDPSADATNWVKVAGATHGVGGTTATGNVTLTVASPAALTVTPVSPGLYITLPDATTCTKADNLYSVYNAGDYDYGVKDSAGTQLGWVRSKTGAMIGLSDSSTAAGVWAYYGLEKVGTTAIYVNSTLTNMGTALRRVALDSNRTCFLFGGTDCYAIVYDASTQTWGSATLVRATVASGAFLGVLAATNKVLVVSCDSTTGMQTVTLTIAANSVTVNTPVSTTLGGTLREFDQLIAIPSASAFAVSFYRATNLTGIRAITVSGTVPTIGAEVNPGASTTGFPAMFVSGSVLRVVTASNSSLVATPYTVSGTTLSVGTTASATISTNYFRAFLNGNGNIVCHYTNGSHYATIFKLTGTTEAASSVSLGTAPSDVLNHADYVQITANKTAFTYDEGGGATWYANILTDTSGAASAGTEISGVHLTIFNSGVAGIAASGNNARFCLASNSAISQITLDCSGASPTLLARSSIRATTEATTYYSSSDKYGLRHGKNLLAGTSGYALRDGSTIMDMRFTPSAVDRMLAVSACGYGSVYVAGAASNESFSITVLNTTTTGVCIQRFEAAA